MEATVFAPLPKSKPDSSAAPAEDDVATLEPDTDDGDDGGEDEEATAPKKEVLATDSLFKIAAAAAAEPPQSMKTETKEKADAESTLKPKAGWQIQIGAYPTRDGAMRIIKKALSMDLNPLAGKTAFAIPIKNGSSTLYRARFSGFDQSSAQEACKELESKGLSCLPLAPQG
jgi:D-alanyl-D-alanine carboxypeptidase